MNKTKSLEKEIKKEYIITKSINNNINKNEVIPISGKVLNINEANFIFEEFSEDSDTFFKKYDIWFNKPQTVDNLNSKTRILIKSKTQLIEEIEKCTKDSIFNYILEIDKNETDKKIIFWLSPMVDAA